MSELKKFQDEVGEWAGKTFNPDGNTDIQSFDRGRFAHLTKEVLELGRALEGFYHGGLTVEHIAEELADCNLLLLHISHIHNVDLFNASRDKLDKNRTRTWGKPDKDGVIEHVKEPFSNLWWCSAKEHRKIMDGRKRIMNNCDKCTKEKTCDIRILA